MGFALFLGTVFMVGWDGLLLYAERSSSNMYGSDVFAGYSPPLTKGVSLLPFLHLLLPGSPSMIKFIFAVSVLLGGWFYVVAVRKLTEDRDTPIFDLVFALQVSLAVLFSPYLMIYDLSIMLIPFIIFLVLKCRLGDRSWQSVAMIWAIVGFFTEFLYRSVSLGPCVIQSSTVFLILWVVFLGRKIYTMRPSAT